MIFILVVLVLFFAIRYYLKSKEENDQLNQNQDKKRQYLVTDFEASVTGIFYKSNVTGESRQKLIKKLEDYEPVSFKPEPSNEFDKNAVLVLNENNEDIGYLNKKVAKELTPYLNENYIIDAVVEKIYKIEGGKTAILNIIVREEM